jgi:hypothetical protein
MMYYQDPGDGSGSGSGSGSGGSGGTDTGIVGGTDPSHPPTWHPIGGTGWWSFIDGMWRWFSEPAPSLRQTAP